MNWEEMRAAGQAAFDAGNYAECERLWTQALEETRSNGEDSLRTATSSLDLARVYHATGKYSTAEGWIETASQIRQDQLGKHHLQLAECFTLLAQNYAHQGKYNECEQLYKRVLQIREKGLGKKHPEVADSMQEL